MTESTSKYFSTHYNSCNTFRKNDTQYEKKRPQTIARHWAIGAGIIGLIAFSIIVHSTNNVPKAPLLTKPEVSGRPFPAFYLKNDIQTNEIREKLNTEIYSNADPNPTDQPGIIHIRHNDPDCEGFCVSYVKNKIGATPNLYTYIPYMQGYEAVQSPLENDIILYMNSQKTDRWPFTHVGLVAKVENDEVWISSKFGDLNCYDHLEEAVPKEYGDAVVYMRKK